MPSTATSSGQGREAMRSSASRTSASSTSALNFGASSRKNGRKWAAEARPCSRWRATRAVLLSAWSRGTTRSSTSTTVTFAQSRSCSRRASNMGMGDLPPDTARLAWPRAAMAARRALAMCSARAAGVALGCSVTAIRTPLPRKILRAPSRRKTPPAPSCPPCTTWAFR